MEGRKTLGNKNRKREGEIKHKFSNLAKVPATGKVLATDGIVPPDLAKLRASKGTRLCGCACNPSLREAGNEGSCVGLEANLSYTVRICLTIAPN